MGISRKVHIPLDAPVLPYSVIELVDRGYEFELLLEQAKAMSVCAVDTETTSNFDEKVAPYKDWAQGARAFMATFCASDDTVFATYDPGIAADILLYLENENIRQVYQNAKFDLHHLREWIGYVPKTLNLLLDDTMHGFRLRFPRQRYALKVASARYVTDISVDYFQSQVTAWLAKEKALRAEGSLFQGYVKVEAPNFSDVPKELMLPYAAHDAYLTLMSWYGLKEDKAFESPLYQSEIELAQLLVFVEKCGWHVKEKEVNFQYERAKREFEAASNAWSLLAPEVSWKSNVEVGDFFYNKLEEPVVFKTDGNSPSTSEAAILKFSKNPLVRDTLLRCRHWKKALDTLENIKYYTGEDGNVHTSLGQERAVTGRFGSDHMNLQNIIVFIPSKEYTHVRKCFGPEEEYDHLMGDYKQIEMVVFAEYVHDPNLDAAIIRNDDLHRFTASRMFAISPETIVDNQRDLGKKMNFTMIYLAGIDKIAAGLENGDKGEGAVTYEQIEATLGKPGTHKQLAQFMSNRYHSGYPTIRPWIRTLINNVEKRRPNPYITNKFGRVIPVEQGYEYKAVNYLIQGTAADLMKKAMVRSWSVAKDWAVSKNFVPWKDVQLFITIHDDLGWKVPKGYGPELMEVVRPAMTDFPEFRLPIRVDFSLITAQTSWAEKKKIVA